MLYYALAVINVQILCPECKTREPSHPLTLPSGATIIDVCNQRATIREIEVSQDESSKIWGTL
jgi:hypothetical protein